MILITSLLKSHYLHREYENMIGKKELYLELKKKNDYLKRRIGKMTISRLALLKFDQYFS